METRLGRYLEDKHIWYYTSTYGIRRVKHYKVIEYDLDTKKYTVFNQDVDGPIEYIEILDEKNIEVFVEVIPMEESSEEEEEEEPAPFTVEDLRNMKQGELQRKCADLKLFTKDWPRRGAKNPEMRLALMNKFGLEGNPLSDHEMKTKESSKATAIFFKLASVVAITSTISNFNPKNPSHGCPLGKVQKKVGQP